MGTTPIPNVATEDHFSYLGYEFSFMGNNNSTTAALRDCLENLAIAPLKPVQKLEILRTYLLSRFFHHLQAPSISGKILDISDKFVRKFVKRTLSLPTTSCNAFIYASLKDGGLGITCLRSRIPDILLRRIANLDRAQDPRVTALLLSETTISLASKLRLLTAPFGSGPVAQKAYWRGQLDVAACGSGLSEHDRGILLDIPSPISLVGLRLRKRYTPTRWSFTDQRWAS